MTTAEHMLWDALRRDRLDGMRFRRQVPLRGFVVDFLCSAARLVIELDGSSHRGRREADSARSRELNEHGYTVIRFWNSEVLGSFPRVLARIRSHLAPPLPGPLPPKGGEGRKEEESC